MAFNNQPIQKYGTALGGTAKMFGASLVWDEPPNSRYAVDTPVPADVESWPINESAEIAERTSLLDL